jgi:hypothetical protein
VSNVDVREIEAMGYRLVEDLHEVQKELSSARGGDAGVPQVLG